MCRNYTHSCEGKLPHFLLVISKHSPEFIEFAEICEVDASVHGTNFSVTSTVTRWELAKGEPYNIGADVCNSIKIHFCFFNLLGSMPSVSETRGPGTDTRASRDDCFTGQLSD